jgi:hypothetical protein
VGGNGNAVPPGAVKLRLFKALGHLCLIPGVSEAPGAVQAQAQRVFPLLQGLPAGISAVVGAVGTAVQGIALRAAEQVAVEVHRVLPPNVYGQKSDVFLKNLSNKSTFQKIFYQKKCFETMGFCEFVPTSADYTKIGGIFLTPGFLDAAREIR